MARSLGGLDLNRVHVGHCIDLMRKLPDGCVHTIITSPPYFNLRRYEAPDSVWGGNTTCVHDWQTKAYRVEDHGDDGDSESVTLDGSRDTQSETRIGAIESAICAKCSAWRGQLGLEASLTDYVAHLVEIFRECKRVLRDDGTLWVVIGDSYSRQGGSGKGGNQRFVHLEGVQRRVCKPQEGTKDKDLLGVPWLLAFALRDDGWWLRNDNIWAKGTSGQKEMLAQIEKAALACGVDEATTARLLAALDPFSGNPMPESCRDRSARAHEYVFHFAKSAHYFYDWFAACERSVSMKASGNNFRRDERLSVNSGSEQKYQPKPLRNQRTVWTVNTGVFGAEHYAVFPPNLVSRILQSATSEHGCCPKCGAPWRRIVSRESLPHSGETQPNAADGGLTAQHGMDRTGMSHRKIDEWMRVHPPESKGWEPTCACAIAATEPCIVLDPFAGSGTVGTVADEMGRRWLGLDISGAYAEIAAKRTAQGGLLAWRNPG